MTKCALTNGCRFLGLETNAEILERHTTMLDARLDGYEAILSKQKYLAGNVGISVIIGDQLKRLPVPYSGGDGRGSLSPTVRREDC